MKWRSRAQFAAYGKYAAEQQIVAAYQEVFGREGEAVELVLSDLAAHTGFYRVEPPNGDLSAYQAGYSNGLRAAFGRLFQFLSLSDEQLRALEEAARREASAEQEGLI